MATIQPDEDSFVVKEENRGLSLVSSVARSRFPDMAPRVRVMDDETYKQLHETTRHGFGLFVNWFTFFGTLNFFALGFLAKEIVTGNSDRFLALTVTLIAFAMFVWTGLGIWSSFAVERVSKRARVELLSCSAHARTSTATLPVDIYRLNLWLMRIALMFFFLVWVATSVFAWQRTSRPDGKLNPDLSGAQTQHVRSEVGTLKGGFERKYAQPITAESHTPLVLVSLPFEAEKISASHSALSGILAGFALAALFLLVEHADDNRHFGAHGQSQKAMLLLFVAFLTGSLASYLYSCITGDTPQRAYFCFLFPSCIFTIHIFMLLGGINTTLYAFGLGNIAAVARRISYAVVLFGVSTIWEDVTAASRYFNSPSGVRTGVFLVATIPFVALVAIFIVKRLKPSVLTWFAGRTVSVLCYTILFSCLGIAVIQGCHDTVLDAQIGLPVWISLFLITAVSMVGAWTMFVFPDETLALDQQPRQDGKTEAGKKAAVKPAHFTNGS